MCITTQNENGNYVPAIPLSFMCEKENCDVTDSKIGEKINEYFRIQEECDGSDWDSEPICLCSKHGKNHLKCPNNLE